MHITACKIAGLNWAAVITRLLMHGVQAGLITIHGSLETQLSSAAVLDVLTDYDSLSRVYSTIERSRMVQKSSRKEVFQVLY